MDSENNQRRNTRNGNKLIEAFVNWNAVSLIEVSSSFQNKADDHRGQIQAILRADRLFLSKVI